MPSIQSKLVKILLSMGNSVSDSREKLDVKKERIELEKLGKMFKATGKARLVPVSVASLQAADWVIPKDLETKRTILYFHGGSYNAGSAISHRGFVTDLAIASKAQALIVDYRLAPENPFPAAIEDATTAYDWLVQNGISAGNIIVAGDSAGGGLTLALLVKLRDQKKTMPAMAVCLSPWTDLAGTGESIQKNAKKDIILHSENLKKSAKLYLGIASAKEPYASPLYADFNGFPPLLIQVGSDEILLSDSVNLAAKAKAAGVDVTLEVWEDMQHVWQFAGKLVPEAWKAIQSIGHFIDSRYL
jgi:monoterpene epsilon-lactone hydrolase